MAKVNKNLTKILSRKYSNKWVALNPQQTKIVGFGGSPVKAISVAQSNGVVNPVLTFVVNDYGALVS